MMLTVLRLARCSVVTRGWLARKATRGGARERVVGRWVASSCRNTAGSNLGTAVTRRHGEQLQLPGQGDGEAALVQHAGHRHVQPEDVVQGQHAHRHLLLHMASDHYNPSAVPCCLLTSWNTLNLGWRYCAICAVRLPWVSSTPFATPVVPLL